MEVRVVRDNKATINKDAFNQAILEFTKQAIMAQMARNFVNYEKTDAFCANVILLEDMKGNGFIDDAMEEELLAINNRMHLDWMDKV